MISSKDLRELLAYSPELGSSVLSLYLNIDQRLAVNLNRGFEAAAKSMLQKQEQELPDEEEKRSFSEDARQLSEYLASYQPAGRTLIIFNDLSRGYLWVRELQVGLENAVFWNSRPHVRPLLEARDEFERVGVILTDRGRARLFTVFLNEIQENHEALAEADVRKFDGSGADQMRSQMNFQRKSDEHAHWHFKHVAKLMDRIADLQKFDRLVLGGTTEAVAELKAVLPDRLRRIVVGSMNLPVDSTEVQVLEETMRLQEAVERSLEEGLVEELLTAAAKNHQAVTGLVRTLEALNEGRIHRLVYSHSFNAGGTQCRECGSVFAESETECLHCGGTLDPVKDLLEPVVGRVFSQGGTVEHVKEQAARHFFLKGGGVGAYLRF